MTSDSNCVISCAGCSRCTDKNMGLLQNIWANDFGMGEFSDRPRSHELHGEVTPGNTSIPIPSISQDIILYPSPICKDNNS